MATAAAEEDGSMSTPLPFPLYTFGLPWPDLNEGLTYTDVTKPFNSGETLIHFYSNKYKNSAPPLGWLQRIRNGQISIDGQVVNDPDIELRIGSKLVYHRIPWKEPDAPYLLDVLYEDEVMVAVYKPSGLQVLPGGLFQQRTVLSQLQWLLNGHNSSSQVQKKSDDRELHPVPVHRLGRGTSGILLCAKTKIAKTRLAKYFADGTASVKDKRDSETEPGGVRKILKLYRALVTGLLDEDEIVIKQPIGLMHYPGVASGLYVASSAGKPAFSKVTVLQRDVLKQQSLVQVEIHSGRPHQIRIHLAYIGHPLVGDPLYGNGGQPKCFQCSSYSDTGNFAEDGGYEKPQNPVPGDCGYNLHAHRLIVTHPSSNKAIDVIAPLPSILRMHEEIIPETMASVLQRGSYGH